eukprot:COSAG01_NODE_20605_length_945_cov_1.596927_1_plen_53_part_10
MKLSTLGVVFVNSDVFFVHTMVFLNTSSTLEWIQSCTSLSFFTVRKTRGFVCG